MSLEARLKNLHYLLGVGSFSRWPLHLRFFAPDVFTQWERHTAKLAMKLRRSITIQLTPAELPKLAADVQMEMRAHYIPDVIRAIPVAYEDCKAHVEKTRNMFEDARRRACGVCKKEVSPVKSLVLVCPIESCQTVSHMDCLSNAFLATEGDQNALVPIEGLCPGCHSPIRWSTMLKELSLRTHGKEEIKALFHTKRKKKTGSTTESDAPGTQHLGDDDEELEETWMDDLHDEEEKTAS